MYWDKHRLIAPSGAVIAVGSGPVIEDRFARLIADDGIPAGNGSYLMQCEWVADGRTTLTRTVLGCDRDGWWALDSSRVPATSGRARFMHEQSPRVQREYAKGAA